MQSRKLGTNKVRYVRGQGLKMEIETFNEAAAAIRMEFLPAERMVCEAAASSAKLLATVLEHAAKPGVSIGAGALMIRKLNGSLANLIEAREGFAMAHKAAAHVPSELGFDPAMYGDVSPCPPDEYPALRAETNVVPLRA